MMRLHVRLLVDHFGHRHGINLFRRHPTWYLKGFPVGPELRDQFSRVADVAEVDELVARLEPDTPFPEGADRMVRGHSGRPQGVKLPHGYLESRQTAGLDRQAELVVSGG